MIQIHTNSITNYDMIWITDKNDRQTSTIKTKVLSNYQDLYFTIDLNITKNNYQNFYKCSITNFFSA